MIATEVIYLACRYNMRIERIFSFATLRGKKGYPLKLPKNYANLFLVMPHKGTKMFVHLHDMDANDGVRSCFDRSVSPPPLIGLWTRLDKCKQSVCTRLINYVFKDIYVTITQI
jgi:hypothetical protein